MDWRKHYFASLVLDFISLKYLESGGLTKNLAQNRNILFHHLLSIVFFIFLKRTYFEY